MILEVRSVCLANLLQLYAICSDDLLALNSVWSFDTPLPLASRLNHTLFAADAKFYVSSRHGKTSCRLVGEAGARSQE